MKRILFFIVCVLLISAISACTSSNKNIKLIQAVEEGNLPDVQTSLTDGANINVKTDNGSTALMLGSEKGHTEIVKILLDNGAKVNTETIKNATALIFASSRGHADIVKLLLDKGADINVRHTDNGWSALMMASRRGHVKVVKVLLENGAAINVRSNDGRTALIMASSCGSIAAFPGQKIGGNDQRGYILLVDNTISASPSDFKEVVKLLLQKGADVNIRDENGDSALKIAKKNGRTEIMEILKNAGAKE